MPHRVCAPALLPPEAAPAFARELLQLFRAKLNSCHGPQLADLAWSLAKLKVRLGARSRLYGSITNMYARLDVRTLSVACFVEG